MLRYLKLRILACLLGHKSGIGHALRVLELRVKGLSPKLNGDSAQGRPNLLLPQRGTASSTFSYGTKRIQVHDSCALQFSKITSVSALLGLRLGQAALPSPPPLVSVKPCCLLLPSFACFGLTRSLSAEQDWVPEADFTVRLPSKTQVSDTPSPKLPWYNKLLKWKAQLLPEATTCRTHTAPVRRDDAGVC